VVARALRGVRPERLFERALVPLLLLLEQLRGGRNLGVGLRRLRLGLGLGLGLGRRMLGVVRFDFGGALGRELRLRRQCFGHANHLSRLTSRREVATDRRCLVAPVALSPAERAKPSSRRNGVIVSTAYQAQFRRGEA
jgi:hypothetical protein